MKESRIRPAEKSDKEIFAELFMITDNDLMPRLFGRNIKQFVSKMFCAEDNYFSYKHVHFLEYKGQIAGMLLAFDHEDKMRERWNTIKLFMKFLRFGFLFQIVHMLKAEKVMAKTNENECYFSNLAVYPEYRGMGFGKELIDFLNKECQKKNYKAIVLETFVEKQNVIGLNQKFGYKILEYSPPLRLKDRIFNFVIMKRELV